MTSMVFVLVGLCIGVVMASARVPKTRWLPFIASIVLLTVCLLGFSTLRPVSIGEALLVLVSILLGSSLYAGAFWSRQRLEPNVSYIGWVWRDLSRPGYVRRQYAVRTGDASNRPETLAE